MMCFNITLNVSVFMYFFSIQTSNNLLLELNLEHIAGITVSYLFLAIHSSVGSKHFICVFVDALRRIC